MLPAALAAGLLALIHSPALAQTGDMDQGELIYEKRCLQCHGDEGDGLGPAAERLNPPPRDFTLGLYKFQSSAFDADLPNDDDLFRMIRDGMPGTAMPDWDDLLSEQDMWDVSDPDNLPDADCLYCSFPSLKDPSHDPGPELRHTGEVVTFVPWELFKPWLDTRWKKRGEDYEALKGKIKDKLLSQFLERMPGLADMVDYVELSTPLSTDNFCRPIRGSIYGIEPTPERFRNADLKPKSPIKNLFFAGSEVASVGVIGAMMGGVMSAIAAEPRKALGYFRTI